MYVALLILGLISLGLSGVNSSPLSLEYLGLREVPCGDGTSCKDGQTCCPASTGFGCCPLLNAVCCMDKKHCCPNGYTCDLSGGTCSKADVTWW